MIRKIMHIYINYGLKPAVKAARDILMSGFVCHTHKKAYKSTMPWTQEKEQHNLEVLQSGIIFKELILNGNEIASYNEMSKTKCSNNSSASLREESEKTYYILHTSQVVLHPDYQYRLVLFIKENGFPAFIYTDEYNSKEGRLIYKPDFAPDNLKSHNYIGHCVAVREDIMGEYAIKMVKQGLWQFNLHICDTLCNGNKENQICHLPMALFSDNSKLEEVRLLNRNSSKSFPLVSIIIPNCNHLTDLKRCVESILDNTDYENYEILIVENNSTEKEVFDYYDALQNEVGTHKNKKQIRVLHYDKQFNYSDINNFAVKQAAGELVLLLNNDTKVISPDWLANMVSFAVRENTGAVGACLVYENKTIQHAGVIVGIGPDSTAVHPNAGVPYENEGYRGSIHHVQNYSAVTAACLLVKKKDYEAVGGMDTELAVAYNDIDLCLKLRQHGLLNVYVPEALLYHYESRSRGSDSAGEKHERFLREADVFRKRWSKVIEKGDSYYNPNLSRRVPWELK